MDNETMETVDGADTQEVEKTYTQEEVNDLLQREGDKRVSEALKKADRKKEQAVKEAEKLAKMNAEDRYRYELEQREAAILEKENQLALAENKASASSILAERHISTALVDFVVAADADTMMDNINLLEKHFKQSVKEEVERRLSTSTPKKNLPMETAVTRESFAKMTLQQQAELYQNQPELYKTLIS